MTLIRRVNRADFIMVLLFCYFWTIILSVPSHVPSKVIRVVIWGVVPLVWAVKAAGRLLDAGRPWWWALPYLASVAGLWGLSVFLFSGPQATLIGTFGTIAVQLPLMTGKRS